ncbi:G8 domain-containing protein DDB_G0286311-like [Physella acuta]|uniref:G8 domain-containing protein DDB_G0286311-like n=1 Tax=Physella acuta TaxID=109671 RepID=UPI0027DEAA2E|nr:G8 domain-containing protein DDB_G0286311-like [Physella acuta]
MGLSFYVAVLTLCASACAINTTINQYAGTDGNVYYYTPVYCSSSGSLLQPAYYASLRSTYTIRYGIDCCYLNSSRNQCCMQVDSKGNQTCRCSTSVLCGLEPRIQTTTAEPTTESTTTTTTTTTTPEPTTTTTTPTTTPTTTVTTTPTTTVPPSLCQTSYRILNGIPVSNDCSFESIANITTKNGAVMSCNAVLATATVNGILRRTFVTTTLCTNIIGAGAVPKFDN